MRLVIFLLFSIAAFSSNFNEAVKLFNENKFEEAQPIFESIVRKNPQNYEAVGYLGDIYMHQASWLLAKKQYAILKGKFPKNADYHFKYGAALAYYCKDVSKIKALKYLNNIEYSFLRAAALDPQHINTRWALVVFYCELPAILGGTEVKAKKYGLELMNLSKVDGFLAMGYIEEHHKNYLKAEENYLNAHKIGHSKVTLEKLVHLYNHKLKHPHKAQLVITDYKPK